MPLLTDCKEDIPIIAQEIISEESFRSPSSFHHELDEEAKSLLGREAWQVDYRELKETLLATLRIANDSTSTAQDLHYAKQYRESILRGEQRQTLREYLCEMRDELKEAVSILSKGDRLMVDSVVGSLEI